MPIICGKTKLRSYDVITLLLLLTYGLFANPPVHAAVELPSENIVIKAQNANTWNEGTLSIIQLTDKVDIVTDQTHLTADSAVIWISPAKGTVLEEKQAQITLLGHAVAKQSDGSSEIVRSGEALYVTAIIRGTTRIITENHSSQNLVDSDLYKRAVTYRVVDIRPTTQPILDDWLIQRPWMTPPAQPAVDNTLPMSKPPVSFSADSIQGIYTTDQKVAFVLTGSVKLFQKRPNSEFLELQAQHVVLFTTLANLNEIEKNKYTSVEQAITGAYLEGDVRITTTPPANKKTTEQRLTGDRVFYDFSTDRAILTQAVIHTYDAKTMTPIVLRAQLVRQLSSGEYQAENAKVTMSSFNTPTLSIGMSKVYIRQIETGDAKGTSYTQYTGDDATFRLYKMPFFYLPGASGTFGEEGAVFRNIDIGTGSRFGPSLLTHWGLFESFGKLPPKGTDITYQLDYFGKRGPAIGTDGHYTGGTVTDVTKEPWSYSGDFSAFFVYDRGTDKLDRQRPLIDPPSHARGRFFLQHQHLLPDDWQAQISLGYSSDATFLEEWYQNSFFTRRPLENSLYLKRQRDTEAFTFLLSKQFTHFVTSSDLQQEGAEIQRLPEIGYHRIGDAVGDDVFTFFSQNQIAALDFRKGVPISDYGFLPGQSPGLPSYGTTGMPGNLVYRGDFRQELAAPFVLGQFKVVPYVLGRYTVYSESPFDPGAKQRFLAGAGVRASTAFWKIDDSVSSELFDLHRLRHVIEPEIHLFTSASSTKRNQLFQYDESVDEINDISAVQIALHQQWQTKRGGPGRWRNVNILDVNIEGDFFARKPNDALFAPKQFRGLFFDSMPEASIPRNAINGDLTWRVSDTTEVLADLSYNLDFRKIATASAGIAVSRGDRLSYFIGQRYIQPLNSNITTLAFNYKVSPKYTFAFQQNFDFGQGHSVASNFIFMRHFERFYAGVAIRYDAIGDNSGFFFNFIPEGFGNTRGFNTVFER